MKKIFNILMCLAVVAFAASCSDDNDNPYAHTSTVKITESKLFFEATASDAGRVAFTANGDVTATPSADWCTAVVTGDTVKVSVKQNDTRYTRSASIVLRCKSDSAVVSLVQKGVTVRIASNTVVANTDDATSVACDYEANVAMSVASTPDWAKASLTDGKLKVDFDANNTGTFRTGVIVFRSEDFVDSINVCQYDFENDIKGRYKLTYYRDTTYSKTVTVTATVKDDVITLSGMNLNLPYTFDENTMSFVFSSGSYLGKNGSNFIYLWITDDIQNYFTGFVSGVTISAPLTHDADGNITASFRAAYADVVYTSFMFPKFAKNEFSEANYNGLFQSLMRPVLTRQLAN